MVQILKSVLFLFLISALADAQILQPANGGTGGTATAGYVATAGSGLTLNVSAGIVFCLGTVQTYAGGTLSMTASITNYVYLNAASSCAPAVKTTTFAEPDVPLAVVMASGSAITGITDDRSMSTGLPLAAFGTGETSAGLLALSSASTGNFNTAFGWNALHSNTTSPFNTAVGIQALMSNTSGAGFNTAVGEGALAQNTSGTANAGVGALALDLNTTGSSNTAVGDSALKANVSGQGNTAVGTGALISNTTANNNSAFGQSTMNASVSGANNTAIGAASLGSIVSTGGNTSIGASALASNNSGINNTALGFTAGAYITGGVIGNITGTNSVFIGANTEPRADGETNEVVIGNGAIGAGSNTVAIGNSSNSIVVLNGSQIENSIGNLDLLAGNELTLHDGGGGISLDSSTLVEVNVGDTSGFSLCLNGDGCFNFDGDAGSNNYVYGLPNASGDLALTVAPGAPTYTPGTNISSCGCAAGYICSNQRGEITIVGGTATTGTICTVNFAGPLSPVPGFVQVTQNGGATNFGLGHGIPSASVFTVTAAVTVFGHTVTVDYSVVP
jgi:hypothetical protein